MLHSLSLTIDLLMPLTTASELKQHPTLSLPYKSDILPNMVRQARNMLHKERNALVSLKSVLTRLRGDHAWIPCGDIFSENDVDIFVTDIMPELVERIEIHKPNGELRINLGTEKTVRHQEPANQEITTEAKGGSEPSLVLEQSGTAVESLGDDADGQDVAPQKVVFTNQKTPTNQESDEAKAQSVEHRQMDPPLTDEKSADLAQKVNEDIRGNAPDQTKSPSQPLEETEDPALNASPRPRMLTRHQAQAQASQSQPQPFSSRSPTPHSDSVPIHPLFTVPQSATPDRNFGLPDTEAEDTRRVLSALVQKQEEVVRGATQLYEGLLRADRRAKTVWKWCKAEGHVDEMSDGEDWVDLEEWGLEETLKKGMANDEGDGTGAGGGHGVSAKDGAGGGATTGERKARGRKGG